MGTMSKEEILKILEDAKDKNSDVPMRLVRQAFEKLPEPCKDVMSRQAAIDVAREELESGTYFDIPSKIENLPSAQPELCDGCDRYGASCVGEGCGKLEISEVAKDTNVLNNDCISRQAAIDEVRSYYDEIYCEPDPLSIEERIEALPSAQPERKTGQWIYNSPVTMKCDQCGLVIKDWDWNRFDFCHNCGADMRGEQE